MNLSYRILWIEDDSDFVESFDTEAIEKHVVDQGFDPFIELRTTPEQIGEAVDGTQYDLLIIDYNIAEGDLHGSDVIQQVRDSGCPTEVLFYSNNGAAELRQIAAKQELEGVFFSGRDRDQLLRKITGVFDLTVRKVIDVENMRGIVMSGVAELDHLVTDVIRSVHDNLDEGKQIDLCKKLLGKLRPTVKHLKVLVRDSEHIHFSEIEQLINSITALDPADFEILAKARSFDSSKRVDMAHSLCKDDEVLKPHVQDIHSIKEMLLWRNALAHQKPRKFDGEGFQIFEPTEGKEEAFNAAKTLKLRQDLRTQRATLLAILDKLRKAK